MDEIENNIFDAASKKLGKSNKKKVPSKDRRPTSPEEGGQSPTAADPEIASMLKKVDLMKRDLEKKLSALYEKGSLYRIDIEKYLNDPTNFTKAEWEKLEKDKDFLYNKVLSVMTPAAGLKKLPKSKEKLTKERKGKTLGSRKNWIPMQ